MSIVGYMEGTDPRVLSRLAVRGVQVLPLSNGVDLHGKDIRHITAKDGIALVISYFHKIMPVEGFNLNVGDFLYNCHLHQVPVLIVLSQDDHNEARKQMGDYGNYVSYTHPDNLFNDAMKLLGM